MIFQEPMTRLDPLMRISDHFREAIRSHEKISKRDAVDLLALEREAARCRAHVRLALSQRSAVEINRPVVVAELGLLDDRDLGQVRGVAPDRRHAPDDGAIMR